MQWIELLLPRQPYSRLCLLECRLTLNVEELSPSSSGSLTWETSKKLKTFHYYTSISAVETEHSAQVSLPTSKPWEKLERLM